jgi:Ca2+-transporting ATPase
MIDQEKKQFHLHTSRNIPVMITGDHKLTAKAIAKQLHNHLGGRPILSGTKLAALSEKEFSDVEHIRVYVA